ncbi:hypothetical protein [Terrisporobacter sp.]|uniref:hypothetical protein n=1 Tax=Terrisporobacter sp. TaxID=1965305 RepID=UPI0026198607|nr:hypothetical protein [Terrisporobacter sp.]
MLHTSIGYILVRSFPECAIMLLTGCYFLKLKISKKVILKKAFLLGIIVSLIRLLPISFGIHTILSMSCTLFMLLYLSKDSFINCIMTTCKLFISLILSEFVYLYISNYILKIPDSYLISNYTLKGAIITLPSLGILVLIAIFIQFITNKLSEKLLTDDNE